MVTEEERKEEVGTCPNCKVQFTLRKKVTTCVCGLVAPISAFRRSREESRAWTISGAID